MEIEFLSQKYGISVSLVKNILYGRRNKNAKFPENMREIIKIRTRNVFVKNRILTIEQAENLINDYVYENFTSNELSQKYDIKLHNIMPIIRGEVYKEAKRPENIKEIIEIRNKKIELTQQQIEEFIKDYNDKNLLTIEIREKYNLSRLDYENLRDKHKDKLDFKGMRLTDEQIKILFKDCAS